MCLGFWQEHTLRVDSQDWSELTLEAFPHVDHDQPAVTTRTLVGKGQEARTTIEMRTHMAANEVHFAISEAEDNEPRAWVLRVHLEPGARVKHVVADGVAIVDVPHLSAVSEADAGAFAPFGGRGARPAPQEGHIAELALPTGSAARAVRFVLE